MKLNKKITEEMVGAWLTQFKEGGHALCINIQKIKRNCKYISR